MSNEIQKAPERKSRAHEIALVMNQGPKLETIADAWTLAQAYYNAGMTPKTNKGPMTANELMIVFMAGAELGFGPTWALKNITTFNGNSMLHSDGPISLVLRSGLMEWQKSGYTGTAGKDDYTAWFEVKRKGISEPVRREFSIADARAAGLWDKGIWKQYGQVRMLLMRARAFALRDLFADVLGGIGILEEHLGHEQLVAEPEEAVTGSAGLLNALRAPAESPVVAPRLSTEEEVSLRQAMERAGLSGVQQEDFAHEVLRRVVESLEYLTPEEADRVREQLPEPVEARAPIEEGEDVAWEDVSDEPTPEEIEEIRARELAEAQEQGLFGGAE